MNIKIRSKDIDNEEYLDAVREIIKNGHQVNILISGNSMFPFLADRRDRILAAPLSKPLISGDMALFQRKDGKYVMHRIYKAYRTADGRAVYDFIGDAQYSVEKGILENQVFAEIISVKRKGKWIKKGNLLWNFFAGPWLWLVKFRMLFFQIFKIRCFIKNLFINSYGKNQKNS